MRLYLLLVKHIHADGTYKLIWQKHTLITAGTTDSGFDEYAKHVSKINYIEYDKIDWLKSKCSCCYWAKNYFCSHVIGLAVAKKKIAYKDIHKQIPIGQSRSRGQPKKTKGALEKQDDYSSSTDSLDSSPESVASPEQQKAPKKTYVKKRSPKKRGRKPKLNKSL